MNREQIIDKARAYVRNVPVGKFIPGTSYIPPSGKVINENDVASLMESVFDMDFTEGRFAKQFEKDLIFEFKNTIRSVVLCNSGSSANLLAVTAITAPEFGERSARPGDEVITVAAGFPTTVNPIIQNGLVPVFVDVDIDTFLPNLEEIEHAINPKTKAIVLAHPLGNLIDVELLRDVADEFNLFYIEDCCDGLGGLYNNLPAGSFGDVATLSFYPAHQITGGEGGAVLTQSPMIEKVIESFRDWGRDCWCAPGKENTCGKRFDWKLGDLPSGYDHKYIYSRLGYNLKITDFQASLLVSQLKRLGEFTSKRRYNWDRLNKGLSKYKKYFHFQKPIENSKPSWFGFAITVRETASFSRAELIAFLTEKKIGTRLLFGGNLTKQPAYKHVKYKVFNELFGTDTLMRDCFWIGVYPGITDEMLDYTISMFDEFMEKHK
jgi:CDP-4-dehydro-6-deoxyglucose reductase, E1